MARRTQHPRIEPAHGFMYEPATLQVTRSHARIDDLLNQVSAYLKNEFNPRQEESFRRSFCERLSLLWGPPGTGKTTVMAGVILGWIEHAWESGQPITVGVGASNYNAIDNVLREVADLLQRRQAILGDHPGNVRIARVRSASAKPPLDDRIEDIARTSPAATALADAMRDQQECVVVGGTWQQMGRIAEAASGNGTPAANWFDLLIIA